MQVVASRGFGYSVGLHCVLLLVMIFGLPSFLHRTPEPEPTTISVDILPIAPKSNVKNEEQELDEDTRKPIAEKHTERKQTTEAHEDAAPPKPAEKPQEKPEEKPLPVKAQDVVKAPPPPKAQPKPKPQPPKPKAKPTEDDLDSILKSVQNTAKSEESDRPTRAKPNKKKAKSDNYDNSVPLAQSEMDAIKSQFVRCWNPPAGAKDAARLAVLVRMQIAQDGTVTSAELAPESAAKASGDSFYNAAASAALRAAKMCSPLKNLPPDKFGTWSDMEVNFDPKDLL